MKKYYISAQENRNISNRESNNKEISYLAALEGIVLLKNSVLPIKDKKVALFGPGARHTIKGGTGSGEVNERHATSIYEGLVNLGIEVTSNDYLDEYDVIFKKEITDYKMSIHDAINMKSPLYPFGRLIKDSDVDSKTKVAVYVIARQAGEGGDKKLTRDDLWLSEIEVENIKFLKAHYKSLILVINSGSYLDISKVDNIDIDAIIYFSQQGMEGGRALADIIYGKVSPSGRLTDSWPMSYNDVPFGNEYSYLKKDLSKEEYKEGIYVGYRYYDSFDKKVRYPFGYGLSYSSFVSTYKNAKQIDDKLCIEIEVNNIGKCEAKEVVELYVKLPKGKIDKEATRLVGFAKTTTLKPKGKEVINISVPISYLSSYFESVSSYIVEKGKYVFAIGNDVNNLNYVFALEVSDDVVISKLKNMCRNYEKTGKLQSNIKNFDVNELDIIKLDTSKITTEIIDYSKDISCSNEEAKEIVNTLTTKEKIILVTGENAFTIKVNKLYTPGAVGRTTSKLYKKGIINVSLSDGPAGLRLLKESAIRRNSLRFVKGNPIASFLANNRLIDTLLGDKPKDKHYYQYCTAFPVATSLAQSWNVELVEEIGKAISIEMNEYNITYWLAPALNIHRNPLCGRNFEYFSEDPILSGKMASALSTGVRSISGNYVTIKHFACNNSEENRTFSNSVLDERTLREIYLKGFEIAVKEGRAESVMTSYNLINGTYATNNKDLITNILRKEWGFSGVVMSDWYATRKKQARADIAIAVGNDLIMPGTGHDRKEIHKGIKKGVVTIKDLDNACINIVDELLKSNVANRKENPISPKIFK